MLRVNNLTGFGGGALPAIEVTDDGDSTAESSGGGSNAHTHTSESSTGPISILGAFWSDPTDTTLNSVTWGGSAVTILVQAHRSNIGCAIGIISGAQTGNVVLNFSGSVDDSCLTKISLNNLLSMSAKDTDSSTSAAGSASLTALTTPGAGGVRIAVYGSETDSAVTWTGATEIADFSLTSGAATARMSAAYDLGDDSGTITADVDAADEAICGVSLR